MKSNLSLSTVLLLVGWRDGLCFSPVHESNVCLRSAIVCMGGNRGFGAAPQKSKKPNKKQLLKQLEKTYGGTRPEDISRGTQLRMKSMLQNTPPHMQLALQLHQQLKQWEHRLSQMNLLEQANLPPQDMEYATRARGELDRLMKEHDFADVDLHNLLQQATWDASADAKAVRSVTGDMDKDIQKRVVKACEIVAETVLAVDEGRVLDVGCGFGVLVPFLRKAGLKDAQIYGVDLSSEMIKNARNFYPDCSFQAADFFSYDPEDAPFDAAVFCSSLHDLPDMNRALTKAIDMLAPGGRLVLLHAQGASQVLQQVRLNPVLVPRGLPTTEELSKLESTKLLIEPATSKSKEESLNGYLAVLEKA